MKLITNATFYDFVNFRQNAFILFDDVIREVGDMSDLPDGDHEIIDATGSIVMPGLVSAHTHLYSAFAKGLKFNFHPTDFQELLEQLWWKLDSALDLDLVYHSALSFAAEMVKNGITTIIDHHASKETKGSLETVKNAVCGDLGMRGIFCFETSDRFDVAECIRENNEFILRHHSRHSTGLFGLHASMSLSNQTLYSVAAESVSPIHIHCAESALDQELCLKQHQTRVVFRLNDFHLLRDDSLLAHCVHINDAEIALLRQKKVHVVLNVTSNLNNGVGLPDVKKFLANGLSVLIGNDGISASMTTEYLNLVYTMHARYEDPNAFGLEDLRKIILNNYDYVSRRLNHPIGRIEPGYASDLLIVPYTPNTELDEGNILSHLFFGLFHAFRPKSVFIRGNQVVENHQNTSEVKRLLKESIQAGERLRDKLT